MLLFSKLNKTFLGYLDPAVFFLQIMKMNNFRGDLTDISAKKEALDKAGADSRTTLSGMC